MAAISNYSLSSFPSIKRTTMFFFASHVLFFCDWRFLQLIPPRGPSDSTTSFHDHLARTAGCTRPCHSPRLVPVPSCLDLLRAQMLVTNLSCRSSGGKISTRWRLPRAAARTLRARATTIGRATGRRGEGVLEKSRGKLGRDQGKVPSARKIPKGRKKPR